MDSKEKEYDAEMLRIIDAIATPEEKDQLDKINRRWADTKSPITQDETEFLLNLLLRIGVFTQVGDTIRSVDFETIKTIGCVD